MQSSNKILFVDLNDFSSGCNRLVLNYGNVIDEFRKDDILTDHTLLLSILFPKTQEHQKISTYKRSSLYMVHSTCACTMIDMPFVEDSLNR